MALSSTTVVIVAAALLLPALVSAQCAFTSELQFKPRASPDGLPSYINVKAGPNAPDVFFETPGVNSERPLPPVIVQVVQASGGRALDMTKDGSLVVCSSDPPLRMGGSSVEVNRGEALFDSLSILEKLGSTTVNYTLRFTLTSAADGSTLTLDSPRLQMVDRDDVTAVAMRFRNSGYFIRPASSKPIPVNVSMPPFWIEFVGKTGYTVPAAGHQVSLTPVVVRDDGSAPAIAGYVLPLNPYTGAESVEFAGVSYFPPKAGTTEATEVSTTGVVFKFTTGPCCAEIETSSLSVVEETMRNRFMQFDSVRSYIRYDNEGGTAVLGVPMPDIVIQLFTSQMGVDASNTGIVILASSSQGKLAGAEALVIRGAATFADLTFVDFAPRSAVITFTCTLPSGKPAKLYSGAIFVTDSAIKASRLRFDDDSKITDNSIKASAYAVPGVALASGEIELTLPTTRVLFVDSANRYDLTADDIPLRLDIDAGQYSMTVSATGSKFVEKKSNWGTVTWDRIKFKTTLPANKTFTVRITDPAGIRTPPLVSAKYRLLDASKLSVAGQMGACVGRDYCPLKLRFANEFGSRSSTVDEEDVAVYTTAGSTMSTIVLAVEDWFGPVGMRGSTAAADLTVANAPTVRAYTGSDPQQESVLDTTPLSKTGDTRQQLNDGRFQNGYYIFECLRIKAATGLVRINFVALDPTTSLPYEGFGRPRTGFTTVLASPMSGYAVEFASASLLQYGAQTTSAVLGVAMSPIVFRVMDSQNKHDTADSSVVVAATASTGDTTAAVTAQKGFVNFTLLQFRTAAEEPTWTFSVIKSSNTAGGQTLKTGKIRLSTLPIPLFEMVFDDTRGTASQVTSAFQDVSVAAFPATLTAVLMLRDSAHEVDKTEENLAKFATAGITVEVSSYDADVATSTHSFVLDPAQALFGKVSIATEIKGVKDGVPSLSPVHLRYRVTEGPAILIGQTLVIKVLAAGAGASCGGGGGGGGGGGSSAVIAEFVKSSEEFSRTLTETESQIAGALGVEAQRVNVTQFKPVTRIDHTTLKTLAVTKATVAFLDPLATSTIRKSRSDLANEFLQVRPACDLPALKLYNVYTTTQDRDCVVEDFRRALSEAHNCTVSGKQGMCQCYESGVVQPYGSQCAEMIELSQDLVLMCNTVRSSCQQSGIQTLCANVLLPKKGNMIWMWSTLGGVGFVTIVGIIIYKRRQAKKREVLTLTGGAS